MTTSNTVSLTRRSLFVFDGLTAGALALGGCVNPTGGNQMDNAPLGSGSGTASGEITILDDNTNSVFKDGLIKVFEEQTGIKVKSYETTNFNDLHDRFATLFVARDTSFDVIMTWAGWSAEFGQIGWLQEIDKGTVPSDLIQSALDVVSWNGKIYGLPRFTSAQSMFWDKDHLKQAGLDPEATPENWDSFVPAAKTVTTDGRYGYTCDMSNPVGAYQNFLRALLLAGGELYDAQWNPQLNSETDIEGLIEIIKLLHLHKVMDPASLQITNASDLVEVFAQDNISIVFNRPFQWAVANASGVKTAGVVGNGLIPGIGARSISIDGSEGYAINVNSTNKAAAMKWLGFASSNVAQKQIVEKEGWFPVSRATLADPVTVEALPVVKTYGESTKYVTKRYGTPWSSELDQLLSVQASKAMDQEIEPKATLDSAQEQLKPVTAKYIS